MKKSNSGKLPEFDRFTIDMDTFCLRNGAEEVFIEPRLIRLLELLCRNANEVVRKKDIMDSVWQNVIVSEESVPRAILDLKRTLNTRFSNPPEIQTIRKVGYRLTLIPSVKKNRIVQTLRVVGIIAVMTVGLSLFLIMLVRAINY